VGFCLVVLGQIWMVAWKPIDMDLGYGCFDVVLVP
jgi:hypothetical protein